MPLPINPDYLHYIVDSGLAIFLWKGVRVLNKWIDIMTENPPHRHVNGLILYPKGMEPGEVEHVGRTTT